MNMKKIKLTESDLYRIVRVVLLEQEENNKRVWNTTPERFIMVLNNVFNGNSEMFRKILNKKYDNIIINEDLDLSESRIKTLPDNLKVKGYLNLNYTKIESLPDNLHVEGNLYLAFTRIYSLPDNLRVGGKIYIHGTLLVRNSDLVAEYRNKHKIEGYFWSS